MRLYHFTLIFAIFALGMLFISETGAAVDASAQTEQEYYHGALTAAAKAASEELSVACESMRQARDTACDVFFTTLAVYLGLGNDSVQIERLNGYVPVILITDADSFCISYYEQYTDELGRSRFMRVWTPWLPYCSLSSGAGTQTESDAGELMSESIGYYMEYFCSRHNKIAGEAGITYSFFIPDAAGSILKNISGRGFYALFQGYPMAGVTTEDINLYSFAGVQIKDSEEYYINTIGTGYASPQYYHSAECPYNSGETMKFNTRRDCALQGAYACPECGGGYH